MQISRCFSLACATAIVFSPILLRADNEAQIRAREALEQKMQQMNAEPATSAPPATVTQPPPAPPAPVQKPTPPPVQQPAVTQSTTPVSTPPPPAPKPAKKKVKAPKPAPAEKGNFAPITNAGDTQTDEKLQNALQQRMTQTPAPPIEQQAPPTAPESHKKTKEVATQSSNPQPPPAPRPAPPQAALQPPPVSTLPPLPAPPSPLSASKQQRLDVLLQQYRSDQITPQQYHDQRAKILSEP